MKFKVDLASNIMKLKIDYYKEIQEFFNFKNFMANKSCYKESEMYCANFNNSLRIFR